MIEIDPARDRQEPEPDRDEHDKQQAPPEDRHRIAEQRDRHQRLIEKAAAPDRGDRPGRHADPDGEQHGEERKLERRGKEREELASSTFCCVASDTPKSPCSELPDVIEELLPHRLIEPELMTENC